MAVDGNSSEETENVALLDGFQRGESADDPITPEESLELKAKNSRSILARTAHQISQGGVYQAEVSD
ncbi:hypothetical protein K2173_005057 [Erythroxylum novogranatense]|uniref:Uncharacterized protein n=1 Tax=Erythroxylum novogranatense TaxID=1862640 RepID=A0AAV8TDM4_9ROSI|nr:hypothetical protein K2173_005057 [Erythroxylum novogranatense]